MDQDSCEESARLLSDFPNNTTLSCTHRIHCEGLKIQKTDDVEFGALESDYITQMFLRKNDISLSSLRAAYNSIFDPSTVVIMEDKRDKALAVAFNVCGDITRYSYDEGSERLSAFVNSVDAKQAKY